MPIEVQVGDTTVEFPDGTSPEVMKAALRRHFPPPPSAEAPKLQAGQTGEKPASLRLLESIVGPLGNLAGADPNAVSEAARQAQPAMGMAGTAIDLGAGAVKGVGQMGGGFLQLVNRLTSDPEVRQKIAEQVAEATPRPAGGAEQVGSAGAHLASFAIPAALGANIARVPLSAGVLPFLRNAAARAALEGGEFGAIRAVQQGSTETLPQDIAMGGALAPLGAATSLAAKGAERVLPALGATTEVMGQMAQHPAVAAALERGAGKVIARGAGAVGGLPFGGMGALAGSVYGPTVAQGVAKGAGGLLGGAGRAMQAKVLTDALATIAEQGPLGAAGRGILKLIRSVGGKQAAQEAEAVAAQAAAPEAETLRPTPAAVPRKPYVPEFSPETLGLEPLDTATTMPQVLARRAAPPVEAPGAAIPAEAAAVGSQAAQAAPGPIPAPPSAPVPAQPPAAAPVAGKSIQQVLEETRTASGVPFPGMGPEDAAAMQAAQEAQLARVAAKNAMAHAFEAQLKAQEPGAKAATVKAAERAQAKALEAKTLADTLLARFDESGNWDPEYPQWSPASPAHERWMGTAPEPASVAGITPPKGGHVPVGAEVFPRRPGEALPAYTPPAEPGAPPDSLEALLMQTLANAKANPLPKLEPRPAAPASPIRVVPGEGDLAPALRASLKEPPSTPPVEPPPAAPPVTILPEGQRAMADGRSGTAKSPKWEFKVEDPKALKALEDLLAEQPAKTKGKTRKPRLVLRGGKLTTE